jgi:hypothetical protein
VEVEVVTVVVYACIDKFNEFKKVEVNKEFKEVD